jgi:hypothetical protein
MHAMREQHAVLSELRQYYVELKKFCKKVDEAHVEEETLRNEQIAKLEADLEAALQREIRE